MLQLLEINLTRNDFEFNNPFFLQIKGTAIGKKVACYYVNIYMAGWEYTVLAACPKNPLHYYRFLDDIWGIWPHSREDFDSYLITLNNHNPSIKFKADFSLTSVDFLVRPHLRSLTLRRMVDWTLRVLSKRHSLSTV